MADIVKLLPEPNANPPLGSAFVTLAGKEWPIPRLGTRQNRIVVGGCMRLFKRLMPVLKMLEQLDADKRQGTESVPLETLISTLDISTEDYDLLGDVTYTALTRAHPLLQREQFLDLDITLMELLMALPIIAQASGFLKKAEPGEQPAKNSQTGTA